MANFTIADIKALREQLGTGMVDTKKALEEADGDVEKATEILRLKGAKGNAKRADRSTSEGLVVAREIDEGVWSRQYRHRFFLPFRRRAAGGGTRRWINCAELVICQAPQEHS